MANWESLKRAQEATYEGAACGDPTLEMSGPWDAHQEGVEWNWPDLRRKPALCADGRARQRRTQKIMDEPQVLEDTKLGPCLLLLVFTCWVHSPHLTRSLF